MNVKFTLSFSIFALLGHLLIAQQVRVIDRITKKGIRGVLIFSSDTIRHTSTDEKGMAILRNFLPDDLLTFRHPGYQLLHLHMADIAGHSNPVLLTEKIISIEEIVISASKWEQNPQEIPNQMLAIQPDEIMISNAQTSADLLEQTGQVFVQKSQLGGGSPMIRGFAANSVLLIVDGIRMNNAIFRSGNLQNIINIDPNMLQSAEVLFGPGSVIYGSDALGGVMDFHTLQPGFNSEKKPNINATVWIRYASSNQERIGHAHLSLEKKRLSYLGSFSYSAFSDLTTGSKRPPKYPDFGKRPEYVMQINGVDSIVKNEHINKQIPSAYSSLNILQKLSFRPGKGIELDYGFYLSKTSDIPRYDRLTEYQDNQLKYAEWYYGPQNWMMNSLRLHFYKPRKWFDEFRIITAWQQFNESRHDRKYRDPWIRHRKERVDVYSLNFDLEKSWENKQFLFYGLEYTLNEVRSTASTVNIQTNETGTARTRYPDEGSQMNSFALYASYKNEIFERTYLSAGARFNFFGLNARFSSSSYIYDEIKDRYRALSGSLGIVYNSKQGWNLNFLISNGFRAPNIDDIAKVFDSEPRHVIVPNPNLKPEYAYNAEARASKLISGKIKVSATIFYSFLRNAMVRRDFSVNGRDSIYYDGTLSKVQALVNTGKANIYGGNIFLEAKITSHWTVASYLNYIEGKDLDGHLPLRHTTPLFGKTIVSYTCKSVYAEFYVRYNGKRSFKNLPPSEQNKPYMYTKDGSPAWYTLNVRGNWKINRAFQINVALQNLLNHHYRPYSSGISAPGRNLIITLKATF